MTVSHVINEHKHVRESTRAKVLVAMDDLGYRVNVAARNLPTGRTDTIGLAVPEIDRPYWGQLGAAIIAAAERHGLRVVIEQTGRRRDKELNALAMSRNRLYDGLILSTVGLGPADAELLNVGYPVVILGERIFDGPSTMSRCRMWKRRVPPRSTWSIVGVAGSPSRKVSSRGRWACRACGPGLPKGARRRRFHSPLTRDEPGPVHHGAGADAVRGLAARGVEFDGVFCVTDTIAIGVLGGWPTLAWTFPNG